MATPVHLLIFHSCPHDTSAVFPLLYPEAMSIKAASRMKPRKSQLITVCAVSRVDNELLIIGENELELEDLALNKYRLEIERFLTIKLARIWSILR